MSCVDCGSEIDRVYVRPLKRQRCQACFDARTQRLKEDWRRSHMELWRRCARTWRRRAGKLSPRLTLRRVAGVAWAGDKGGWDLSGLSSPAHPGRVHSLRKGAA